MTDDNLIVRAGEALFGDSWQAPLSRQLGVHKDTVQDWRQERSRPRKGVYRDVAALARERRKELDLLIPLLDRTAEE